MSFVAEFADVCLASPLILKLFILLHVGSENCRRQGILLLRCDSLQSDNSSKNVPFVEEALNLDGSLLLDLQLLAVDDKRHHKLKIW